MTVARQGSPILDPDLRSQPLREAACHGLCPLSDSDATLGTEGRRPDGCHTPLCAEGAGPYGNTAAPPTGIYCHWQYLLSVPRSFVDAQDDSGRRSPILDLDLRSQPLREAATPRPPPPPRQRPQPLARALAQGHMSLCRAAAGPFGNTDQPTREALIKSLSIFILAFLFNARNQSTRIASYLRRLMRSIG